MDYRKVFRRCGKLSLRYPRYIFYHALSFFATLFRSPLSLQVYIYIYNSEEGPPLGERCKNPKENQIPFSLCPPPFSLSSSFWRSFLETCFIDCARFGTIFGTICSISWFFNVFLCYGAHKNTYQSTQWTHEAPRGGPRGVLRSNRGPKNDAFETLVPAFSKFWHFWKLCTRVDGSSAFMV